MGLHWFNSPTTTPMYSGDTFLKPYISAIQAAMVGETLTTISPVLGDLNFDGKVTTADMQALLSALANSANLYVVAWTVERLPARHWRPERRRRGEQCRYFIAY